MCNYTLFYHGKKKIIMFPGVIHAPLGIASRDPLFEKHWYKAKILRVTLASSLRVKVGIRATVKI